jgi:asparagine synthase (glutamine-hydrolysing)
MCGIFGVWNFQQVRGSDLHNVSALLRHRGPDDEGIAVFDKGQHTYFSGRDTTAPGLPFLPGDLPCPNTFLHRRLSILDLSEKGHQPMKARHKNIHIVFNGEIYNFRELIELHRFDVHTGTDTELVLAMYEKFGMECFAHFRGMWAMAIFDYDKNELILSRDRFGIKPLYYSEFDGALAFSTEIKPLLSLEGIEPVLSKAKLLQFLTFGATADPHETFFDSISAIAPGTSQVWNLSTMRSETFRYYKVGEVIDQRGGVTFEEVFKASIQEHIIADVEVGSCLSGGLDSSAIVAEASKAQPNFKTFTCSFPGEKIDESDFARGITKVRPNLEQHFTTPTSVDFFKAFDDLVLLQERPIGSASVFAQYAVMQLAASKGLKVLLDGQGADEVMGGYYPFAGAYLLGLLRKGKLRSFKSALADLKSNFNPAMGKAMLRAGYYLLPEKLQSAVRRKGRVGSELIAPSYRKLAAQQKSPQRGAADFQELAKRSIRFGLYELLHYEDRNAMRFGIESRVPFLDHRIVEWALAQEPSTLIKNGWTKHPIRALLEKEHLPSLAWRKDKLGFVAPQSRWRETLKPALIQKLEGMEIPDIFDRGALQAFMTAPLTTNEEQTAFWRIYALLRWIELFKVRLV